MRPHKTKSLGFTLLEILVALFIFTIIAVIMTRALHSVMTTQAATEQHAKQLADLQLALLLVSRDLEQTVDRPIIDSKGDGEPAFAGSASSLSFTHGGYANPNGQLNHSTLQHTRYFIDQNNLIRETAATLDPVATTPLLRRKLLSDINEIQFSYLDQQQHFHNSWPPTDLSNPPVFPVAVRVTLTLRKWGKINQLYLLPGQPFDAQQK